MKQPVFLRVYLNGKLENVKQFSDQQIVIGRNADLQLSLHDESVSPLHAVIEERDNGYYVSDLGSQNGTMKGGNKVFDEKIESGDELIIGPYKLEFFIGVPKPKAAPTPVATPPAPVTPVPVNEKPKAPEAEVLKPKMPEAPPPASLEEKAPPVVASQKPKVTGFPLQPIQPLDATAVRPAAAGTTAPLGSATVSAQKLGETLKKSQGSIVEVIVAWRDRVLATYHYSEAGEITIGANPNCDIVVPLIGTTRPQHKILKLASAGVRVCVTAEMTGDYYKEGQRATLADLKRMNRMTQVESGYEFDLLQGEAVRLGMHGDVLNIFVRFTPEVPKPIIGSMIDLSASETASIIMSVLVTGFFALYMMVYTPNTLDGADGDLIDEPIRRATVTFTPPKKIVMVTEQPQQEKQVVEVAEKKQAVQTTTKQDPGKASAPKPSEIKAKPNQVSSAIAQGAAIKTSNKESANMKTKDIGKTGLLGVFGSKGTQKSLSQATSGAGELIGTADSATGTAGNSENRAGDSLGGRLKNVGGGKGTSTIGIGGVGTVGKGTGPSGLGTGGIGKKGNVDINVEGEAASFTGSIDKEAIRRVIRENRKLFQYCYDQALRRNSDAYGKVEIQWDIEERGRATNALVKSNSSGDSAFGTCVRDKIKGLTFPEPPADQVARVVFPFVFAAQ